ncbi:hypothetical protein OG978_19545 [Streptomyces sp. NBC_01591]|uniref:hypothetical protein n=1 Tax=Streptomyces sp. NBC_01591 TaxID=2975888 RepID=UPI002DDB488A|nr:hypothetical protein [Streptomyces sp. NBC_01591]WSD69396.1 hypothetical protein OG978_19545 [Streptomyces sp. NBC_01591]
MLLIHGSTCDSGDGPPRCDPFTASHRVIVAEFDLPVLGWIAALPAPAAHG